jgi:hypothetical protein
MLQGFLPEGAIAGEVVQNHFQSGLWVNVVDDDVRFKLASFRNRTSVSAGICAEGAKCRTLPEFKQ